MTVMEVMKNKSFNDICEGIKKIYEMNQHELGTCMVIYNFMSSICKKVSNGYKIEAMEKNNRFGLYACRGNERYFLKDLSIEEIMNAELSDEKLVSIIMIMLSKIDGDVSGILWNIELFIAKGLV